MSEAKLSDRVARSAHLAAELSLVIGPPLDEAWRAESECRSVLPDRFFDPEYADEVKEQFCSICPVRSECLEFALSMSYAQCGGGVWGGMDDTELRRERRRRSMARYKIKKAQQEGNPT